MSEAKHTPGPWRYYLQGDSTAHIVCTAETDNFGRALCDVTRVVTGEANARLIAAAPDLLEALRLCSREIGRLLNSCGEDEVRDSYADMDAAHNAARAAIAKAEGRTTQ